MKLSTCVVREYNMKILYRLYEELCLNFSKSSVLDIAVAVTTKVHMGLDSTAATSPGCRSLPASKHCTLSAEIFTVIFIRNFTHDYENIRFHAIQ